LWFCYASNDQSLGGSRRYAAVKQSTADLDEQFRATLAPFVIVRSDPTFGYALNNSWNGGSAGPVSHSAVID
jgi:hypothetical protein